MFNTYMRTNVVRHNIKEYCNFIRNFIDPNAVNTYEELIREQTEQGKTKKNYFDIEDMYEKDEKDMESEKIW